jgi:hypothetical protein
MAFLDTLEIGKHYYVVLFQGNIQKFKWLGEEIDNESSKFGNCFKTREQAEQAREKIKEVLLHIHDSAV